MRTAEIVVKSRRGSRASSRRYECLRCARKLRACEFEVRLTAKGARRTRLCRRCRTETRRTMETPWTTAKELAVTFQQFPELAGRRLQVVAVVNEAAESAADWQNSALSADEIVTRAGFGYAEGPLHWHRIMRAVLIRAGEMNDPTPKPGGTK